MGITRTLYDWLGRRLEGDGDTVETLIANAQKIAMTDAAFRICCSYVGAALSKAEFVLYDGNGRRADPEWETYTWNVSPNPNQTRAEFVNGLVFNVFSEPRAIVIPERGSLWLAGYATPKRELFAEDVYENLSVDGYSVPGAYRARDLYVFSLGDPDVGKLVANIGETYGEMLTMAKSMYGERAGRKYKLKLSSTKATVAGADNDVSFEDYVNRQLKTFVNSDSAVLPEFAGMDLQPIYSNQLAAGLSGDFISLRKDCFEAVATAMKMPVSMIYGNVNNFSEVFRSFITFAVMPVASMVENELTRKSVEHTRWRRGARWKVDLSCVKYTDLFDAAADADKLVASSLLSPNDTLRYLGLDGIDADWADGHYITRNYSPVGEEPTEGGDMQ